MKSTRKILARSVLILTMCVAHPASADGTHTPLTARDNPLVKQGPPQPIAYSHRQHLAMGLACAQCHAQPEPAKLMTFPSTGTCMNCHREIAKDKPEIRKLAEFHRTKTQVPWIRVYTVTAGVNWSHRPHLESGIACADCHGNVAELTVMTQLKSPHTMGGCVDCHTSAKASVQCETCHTAWSPEMTIDVRRWRGQVDNIHPDAIHTGKTAVTTTQSTKH